MESPDDVEACFDALEDILENHSSIYDKTDFIGLLMELCEDHYVANLLIDGINFIKQGT